MGGLIWLASYPKSGNTWMRSFLHNLLRNSAAPVDINEIDQFCLGESAGGWYRRHLSQPIMETPLEDIAALRPTVHREFTQVFPDSVFVKTHNFLGDWYGQPLHNMDVTAGAIYVVRNPLDVVISMTHHFGVDVDGAIARMGNDGGVTEASEEHIPEFHSSWSRHVESWTSHPNPQLYVVRYEDLLAKPRKYFKEVTQFLGLNPPRERLERAIRNSSFKVLKEQERKRSFKEKSQHAEAFFREGRAEQWRDLLSRDQVRAIIDKHGQQMERFGYIPADY